MQKLFSQQCGCLGRQKRHAHQNTNSQQPTEKFVWTIEAVRQIFNKNWHIMNSIIYHDFFDYQTTSIAILQLPAFSLALLGLLRAKSCSDVLRTVPSVCTPFFLLGFLDFFFSFLFQQCTKKGLEKAGLLWFLGSTEEQRALGLDTSRAFSGHAIQLLFQVFLGPRGPLVLPSVGLVPSVCAKNLDHLYTDI